MRVAASQAGLIDTESSEQLELALEPEAACVACETESANLEQGDTFMILDAGGGTVDITMHTVRSPLPSLKLDELCAPSGGPWGSTYVDAEFEQFIKDLIGPQAFAQLKPSSQWVELMRTWEGVKLGCDPESSDGTKSININPALEVHTLPSLSCIALGDDYCNAKTP